MASRNITATWYSSYWTSGRSSVLALEAEPVDRQPLELLAGTSWAGDRVSPSAVLESDPNATFILYGEGIPEELRASAKESRRFPLGEWRRVVAMLRARPDA